MSLTANISNGIPFIFFCSDQYNLQVSILINRKKVFVLITLVTLALCNLVSWTDSNFTYCVFVLLPAFTWDGKWVSSLVSHQHFLDNHSIEIGPSPGKNHLQSMFMHMCMHVSISLEEE